jgi:hypothetical protein
LLGPRKVTALSKGTSDVDTIANVNAATSIITMEGNYTITANFAVNWLPIGGIAAVVVAARLAIFFVRRRIAARKKH